MIKRYNKWTELFKKNEQISIKYLICSSILCSSSIITNVINTLLLFYKNTKPVKIFTSEEDAIDFINEQLK